MYDYHTAKSGGKKWVYIGIIFLYITDINLIYIFSQSSLVKVCMVSPGTTTEKITLKKTMKYC